MYGLSAPACWLAGAPDATTTTTTNNNNNNNNNDNTNNNKNNNTVQLLLAGLQARPQGVGPLAPQGRVEGAADKLQVLLHICIDI